MERIFTVHVNGQQHPLGALTDPSTLVIVIAALELKADRIAVELNGEIVRRGAWPQTEIRNGDRLEIVHFVGGGLA